MDGMSMGDRSLRGGGLDVPKGRYGKYHKKARKVPPFKEYPVRVLASLIGRFLSYIAIWMPYSVISGKIAAYGE